MNHEQSVAFAKKYTEDLLTFYGLNLEVEAGVNGEYIELNIPSSEANSILIGRNAENLRSLQFLISTTLRNQGAAIDRVLIDVADYKKQREEKLAEKARGWIEGVRKTGDSYVAHLNAADRRVVHNVAQQYDDIRTFSEGEGRERSITIAQKAS